MSDQRLAGRRVLVCGGATGIGAATARLMAVQGAAVCLHYHTRADAAERLRDELRAQGASVDLVQADLTREDDVVELARRVGDVHGIVHSVSPAVSRAPIEQTDWRSFEAHWAVGVGALFLLVRHVVPVAPSLASIAVVLTTYVGGVPPKDLAPYVTGKHALLGFCRSLAVELAARQIRVNCVSPGVMPTPLNAHLDPRHLELLGRSVPLGRLGTPDEAARVIAFLLGPESAFVTGTNVAVAGGVMMC